MDSHVDAVEVVGVAFQVVPFPFVEQAVPSAAVVASVPFVPFEGQSGIHHPALVAPEEKLATPLYLIFTFCTVLILQIFMDVHVCKHKCHVVNTGRAI